ncbi:MAG: hypothetical protein IKB49_04355 [Alphaproteobacteria bacterium]|nr:hypothetical protein [Alphaproteobacteria bacterium]
MKKLTAGIFTALLGLVTVNAANAAIPSTNYVNEHIDAVRYEYKLADTALGTRIDGVESAYKAADSALDTRVTDLETTVGEGEMVVDTKPQADVIAAINALDEKTNGIATNVALETLQNTVNGHTTNISNLQGSMTTAEGDIDDLEALVGTTSVATQIENANNTQTASLQQYADQAETDAIASAKTYADGLNTAATAAIEANTQAIAEKAAQSDLTALTTRVGDAEGDIDDLEALVGTTSVATQIENANNTQTASLQQYADQAETDAIASAKSYADGELAKKVDKAQGAEKANHVVITDASGNVTTSATIAQGQVSGLTDALNGKMPLTTTDDVNIGEDGTYVLTATTAGGATTYKWELIERVGTTPK